VINNEPIIQEFSGYFEFTRNDLSLGFWTIPKNNNIFWQACLGLTSIFKQFRQQKLNNQPYKLNTLLALL